MFVAMLKKEWRELRLSSLIIMAAYLVISGGAGYLVYAVFRGHLVHEAQQVLVPILLEKGPEEILWSNWYGSNLWQIGLGYAVYLSRALYRGEAARGTLDALLAKPISRQWYYATKYALLLSLLALVPTAATLIVWLLWGLIGFWLPLGPWLAPLLQVLPALAFFFGLCVLVDLAAGSNRSGLLFNILFLISLNIAGGYLLPNWLNPYQALVVMGSPNLTVSLVMLALAALLYGVGRWVWLRKEW